jgi:hypothetical protein
LTLFEYKYQIISAILLVFVDASEDSIMADDVTKHSNIPIVLIKEEELEKTSFNLNVSQWLCEKEPFKRVVCSQVNYSAWDH